MCYASLLSASCFQVRKRNIGWNSVRYHMQPLRCDNCIASEGVSRLLLWKYRHINSSCAILEVRDCFISCLRRLPFSYTLRVLYRIFRLKLEPGMETTWPTVVPSSPFCRIAFERRTKVWTTPKSSHRLPVSSLSGHDPRAHSMFFLAPKGFYSANRSIIFGTSTTGPWISMDHGTPRA